MGDQIRIGETVELSVIVCTYNRASLLRETMGALAGQEVPPGLRWEIVVIDNNSRDATRGVVRSFQGSSAVPVRYVFEGCQGLCHARNRGLAASHGAIVAFTDDDVTPRNDWVRGVMAAMRQHGADGVGGKVLPKWSEPPPMWLRTDTNLLGLLAMLEAEECCPVQQEGTGARIHGANMAFRRDLFETVGAFDTGLGRKGSKLASGEDTEFVNRAVKAGKVLVYDPRLVVWHFVGPERMRKGYFRRWRFDTAENEGMHQGVSSERSLLGVPFYVFRRLPRQTVAWLKAVVTREADSFQKELAVVDSLGFLVGCVRRRSRRWKTRSTP